MKRESARLSRQYLAALRAHLKQGSRVRNRHAVTLGRRALAMGLQTLDLAMMHKYAVTNVVTPDFSAETRDGMIKRAETFFVEAIAPIEKTHHAAMQTNVRLNQLNQILRQRTLELAAANRSLKQEVVQRRVVEEALRKSQQYHSQLLEESQLMQEQLRNLSRQLLQAQEEERRQISRELHDEIAQTLTGINVHLANLKNEAMVKTRGLEKKISRTQQLVEKSVNIVHRFARDLRPTVLDDLGLIPALHSFLKDFTKRTGINIRFTAFAGVEQLNSARRLVLYRVAQSALANIAQHARASRIRITIRKLKSGVRMEIKDNGKGFEVERVLFAKRHKRLGLLGMRERVEMVGGSFNVESAPGKGTTIRAQISPGNAKRV